MANIQQIFGQHSSNFLAALEYRSINGCDESTAEERVQRLWLVPGFFRKWRVSLGAPIPGGQALTLTLRINEADTSFAIAFGPGEQNKSYTGADVAVGLDQRIDIKSSLTGAALSGGFTWSFEFEPSSGSKSCYGHNQQNGEGNTPFYYGIFTGFQKVGTIPVETVVGVVPCDGTITNLGVCMHEPPAGTHHWTIYRSTNNGTTWVAQNGSGGTTDTRVIFTGATRADHSTFSLAVSAGDLFYCRCDRTAGAGVNLYGSVSVAFDPATAGEFIIPGLSRDDLNNVSVEYLQGSGGQSGPSPSMNAVVTGISSVNLRDLYVYLEVPPGDGKSFCFDYTENESTSPSTGSPFVTITGTAKAGHDTRSSHWIRLQNGEYFTLRQVPINSPDVGAMTWAAVGKMGSLPVVTPTGCGCEGCAEAAPPPTRGNIGPIAWLDTSRLQP